MKTAFRTEAAGTINTRSGPVPASTLRVNDAPWGRGTYPTAWIEPLIERIKRCAEYADTREFLYWLVAVDRHCTRALGVGLFDLPDMMTRDAFEEGVTPADFFAETVMDTAREEGYP